MATIFLDFIEIGTSDFDTEIQKKNDKVGLSIDPIEYYINKLPNKKGCKKIQAAISNYNGNTNVYYVAPDNIKKYNLPTWVRGCNSINNYHPTVSNLLSKKGVNIADIAITYEIPCKTLLNIIRENNVAGFYYLKIDTEGHDTVILENFCNNIKDNKHLPHKILFESNELSNKQEINKVIELLKEKGYDLIESSHDTLLKLNLNNLKNKNNFMEAISNYYIMDYPQNYNPYNPPHKNNLEDTKRYCIKNNYSGITYQNNRYTARNGKYINYYKEDNLLSWIYM